MLEVNELEQALAPTIEGLGYNVWGVEWISNAGANTLRVYIDKADGITVDDCGIVSAQVGALIDVEDLISSEYTLEISSPGLSRPLFTPDQYALYVGQKVQLKLLRPVEGARKMTGLLSAAEDDGITLTLDNNSNVQRVPYTLIRKGKLVPVFD